MLDLKAQKIPDGLMQISDPTHFMRLECDSHFLGINTLRERIIHARWHMEAIFVSLITPTLAIESFVPCF